MEGLARAIGAAVPIKFDGRDLLLGPFTLADFGVIEQHLLKQRQDPIDMVLPKLDKLPPALAEKLLERAYEDARKSNKIAATDVAEWMDTIEGQAFIIWLLLEKRYPGEYTKDKAYEVLISASEDERQELIRARDQSAGVDRLGNSTGQSPTTTEGALASQSESTGDSASESYTKSGEPSPQTLGI